MIWYKTTGANRTIWHLLDPKLSDPDAYRRSGYVVVFQIILYHGPNPNRYSTWRYRRNPAYQDIDGAEFDFLISHLEETALELSL